MLREWQLVLYTKYSLNTMAEIYLYLLKVFHWSTKVHQHRQKQQQHHKHVHAMPFYYFLSNDIKQDSATTILHIKSIIELLKQHSLIANNLSKMW